MAHKKIIFQKEGNRAFIGLNRPEKFNALSLEMLQELSDCIDAIDKDSEIWTVIIYSKAPKAFSVGADINDFNRSSALMKWHHWVRQGHQLIEKISNLLQPVIVVTQGFVFGGGLEFAVAGDIRIAEESSIFALPETSIGTLPGWGGHKKVLDLIGISKTKMMVFTGDRINAQKALEYGLVDQIVPREKGMEAAMELTEKIMGNSPISIRLSKQIIMASNGEKTGSTLESMASAIAAFSEDGQEGVKGFAEKRKPIYKGG